jgi:hypothetical protein
MRIVATRVSAGVGAAPVPADLTLPERNGRYQVERVLGQGGFGLVYLAHDDQLSRPVAIKVPHAGLVAEAGDAEPPASSFRQILLGIGRKQ